MTRRQFYLALAIIGFVAPYFLFYTEFAKNGFDISMAIADTNAFFQSVFGQATAIWLLISGIALTIFATHEALVRRDYYLFWALLVIIFGGIGAALPFYLYLRSAR